jgi:hypothetical protein
MNVEVLFSLLEVGKKILIVSNVLLRSLDPVLPLQDDPSADSLHLGEIGSVSNQCHG